MRSKHSIVAMAQIGIRNISGAQLDTYFGGSVAVGVLGRHFFSYKSLGVSGHAFLAEASGLGGLDYKVRHGMTLRYQLEYLGRIGRADGLRNVLVLDVSF